MVACHRLNGLTCDRQGFDSPWRYIFALVHLLPLRPVEYVQIASSINNPFSWWICLLTVRCAASNDKANGIPLYTYQTAMSLIKS